MDGRAARVLRVEATGGKVTPVCAGVGAWPRPCRRASHGAGRGLDGTDWVGSIPMTERRDQRLGQGQGRFWRRAGRVRGGSGRRRYRAALEGLEARSLLATNVVLTAGPIAD